MATVGNVNWQLGTLLNVDVIGGASYVNRGTNITKAKIITDGGVGIPVGKEISSDISEY